MERLALAPAAAARRNRAGGRGGRELVGAPCQRRLRRSVRLRRSTQLVRGVGASDLQQHEDHRSRPVPALPPAAPCPPECRTRLAHCLGGGAGIQAHARSDPVTWTTSTQSSLQSACKAGPARRRAGARNPSRGKLPLRRHSLRPGAGQAHCVMEAVQAPDRQASRAGSRAGAGGRASASSAVRQEGSHACACKSSSVATGRGLGAPAPTSPHTPAPQCGRQLGQQPLMRSQSLPSRSLLQEHHRHKPTGRQTTSASTVEQPMLHAMYAQLSTALPAAGTWMRKPAFFGAYTLESQLSACSAATRAPAGGLSMPMSESSEESSEEPVEVLRSAFCMRSAACAACTYRRHQALRTAQLSDRQPRSRVSGQTRCFHGLAIIFSRADSKAAYSR